MEKRKKEYKAWTFILVVAWIAALILYMIPMYVEEDLNRDTILSDMTTVQTEDKVGANIWLKQTIHGVDGIAYRYVIETDCPKWDFETRYMTEKPIEWIDETSAVEVVIYDVQIRYNGTLYASGQYYTIPLLGGLSSENVTYEEWLENLKNQAFQAFVSEVGSRHRNGILKAMVIGIPILLFIGFVITLSKAAAKGDRMLSDIHNTKKAEQDKEKK